MMYYLKQIKSFRDILPILMVVFTKHDRYLPKIEWSEKSWTHNVFRVYEMLFWRKVGIRVESGFSAYKDENGKTHMCQRAYTFEAACSLFETWIRSVFNFSPIKVRVWIPQLASNNGFSLHPSPYLFAIAFDAGSFVDGDGTNVAAISVSHTTSGSDRLLSGGFMSIENSEVTSWTYNSVAMAQISNLSWSSSNNRRCVNSWLAAPATGSNTLTCNMSPNGRFTHLEGLSLTGAAQTGQPDSSATNTGSSSPITVTTTSVADNSIALMFGRNSSGAQVASTGSTLGTGNDTYYYSAIKTPAGSINMQATYGGGGDWGGIIASFSPFVAPSGPANLKTYNTNPKANIKSIDTNLIGNVKSLNTNT